MYVLDEENDLKNHKINKMVNTIETLQGNMAKEF